MLRVAKGGLVVLGCVRMTTLYNLLGFDDKKYC